MFPINFNIHYIVNPEIFARILFSRIALKDIFATFQFRDLFIYLFIYLFIQYFKRVTYLAHELPISVNDK